MTLESWLECVRDPLGLVTLAYVLGSALCGALALALEPMRRRRRRSGRGRLAS